MKKIVFMLLVAIAVHAGNSDSSKVAMKVTEADLTPYEKVYAGVMVINDSYGMSATKRHENYVSLLKLCGITHEQFQKYLKGFKGSSKEWQKALARMNSAFEE